MVASMLAFALALSLLPQQAHGQETLLAYGVITFAAKVDQTPEWLAFVADDCPQNLVVGARRDATTKVMLNVERLWGRTLRLKALPSDRDTLNPTPLKHEYIVSAGIGRECDLLRASVRNGVFTDPRSRGSHDVTFTVHGTWVEIWFGSEDHYKQPYELYLVE